MSHVPLKAGWETFLETLRRPLDMSGLENASDQDDIELAHIKHINVYSPDPPSRL